MWPSNLRTPSVEEEADEGEAEPEADDRDHRGSVEEEADEGEAEPEADDRDH
jgi:hypothetical protein